MKTGYKIMLHRKERGLSLEALGNMVGVGKSTVRKWENGTIANMGRDKIAKLAEVFDVSPSYLISEDSDFESNYAKSNSDESNGIMQKLSKLTPDMFNLFTQFLALAADNPESAKRFLSFAVQELESSKQSH